MDTILKTVLLLSFATLARAGNVFGGGYQGFQGAGFRGPGLQSGGYRGPLFAAAATPGLSAGGASYPPQPYSFGYDTTDEFGTQLFHKEQGDASNAKTGSYGYRDANGLFRTVKYVADANGFRATIDTNEPGTAPGASADAVFNANPVAAPAGAGKGGAGRYGGAKAAAYGAGAGGPWAG
ncbi:adult-specific rigid cuticular protein 15.7-like [Dermacentor silvarum]|uniref:adult-specific rigid cuticular protein 15.7-like n=1 Tax=Dermacentor silvarum TaxID=543639 RepID=UPI002100B66F|nr:adult-specific rigid cuticular protein 15.7-like [Dermacentor silvarum]